MEPNEVQIHLRRCGVVVHHAARMPAASDGRHSVVVFLEGALGQFELARRCALQLPGVIDVSFSGHTRAIMYVVVAESGGKAGRLRHPAPDMPNVQELSEFRQPKFSESGLSQRGPTRSPNRSGGPADQD